MAIKLRCENVEPRGTASVVTFSLPEGRIMEVAAHGPFQVLVEDATDYVAGADFVIAPAIVPPPEEIPEVDPIGPARPAKKRH